MQILVDIIAGDQRMNQFMHASDMFEKGKEVKEVAEQMELGFTTAGLSGKQLEKQLDDTSKSAEIIGNKFGVSSTKIKQLSADIALTGGITGKGNASKQQVIDAIKALGYHPKDDNEADALALLELIRKQHKKDNKHD